MDCPNCKHGAIDITLMGGPLEYICNGCGAHWKEWGGRIVWAAAPVPPPFDF